MGYVTPNALGRGPFGDLKPLAAALTVGFGLTLTPTTYAANFVVNTTADSGAGSLRSAVALALASGSPRSVSFALPPSSTITLASPAIPIDQDLTITGPGSGTLSIVTTSATNAPIFYLSSNNPTVTISGVTLQRTSGTTTNAGGAIYNYGGTLTVLNSVITGHSSSGRGGAIFSRRGTVNVTSSTLSNNSAAGRGGGVYMYYGTISVTGSTVTGNQSTGSAGGAFFLYAGTLTITNSTLSSNKAAQGGGVVYAHGYYYYYYYNYQPYGGAGKAKKGKGHGKANAAAHAAAKAQVVATAQSHPNAHGNVKVHTTAKERKHERHVANAKLQHSRHAQGARVGPMAQQRRAQMAANHTGRVAAASVKGKQVAAASFHTPATVTITGSTFSGNQAGTGGSGDGGALYLKYVNATIQDSTFSGNSSLGDGGAIYHNKWALSVSGSTFSGNQAAAGSAISRDHYYEFNNTTITNSTFSGNTATATSSFKGGAVYFYSQPVTIRNSTFTGNSAPSGVGGGITIFGASLTLQSTIVAGNTDSSGARDIFAFASATPFSIAADHSLIFNGGGFVPPNATNILGVGAQLGPLANNGGTTLTHALLTGSPAIDKGSNPAALAFDQRGAGFPRTVGIQTDIGAVEGPSSGPPPPPAPIIAVPTLSQWGMALLSMLLGAWAAITGLARRRPDKDS